MPILGSIIKSAIEFPSKIPLEKIRRMNPSKQQAITLKKLLSRGQYTALGETYDFGGILKKKDVVSAFRQNVPIHDYNSIHQKWWYRTLNGEAFVSWPGKVKYFALSSGTSEASSKYIPVTADMLKAIKKTSVRQIFSLAKYDLPRDFYERGILMLGGSTHLQYNGTYYEGDLSGITAGNIPFWFQHFYKPGKRISKEREWTTKLEEIIKNAKNWDIGVIVGVPAWLQILMERIISYYNVKTIHDIWPNLSIYVHGGVSFAPYAKTFDKLLAKPLIYIETYLASEGFIAYQSRPGTNAMQLVLDNGLFYEFVPFNDTNFDDEGHIRPEATSITIENVEEGKEYALLLTSCAGAWRYLIGDTIKFTSKALSEIVITGRTKHYLNLCGEHLSQENMNRAIQLLEEQMNIPIPEFTVAGIKHDSMFAHKWYLGTTNDPSTIDVQAIRDRIDQNLKDLNDDYRVERIAAIKEVIVEVLPLHLFYDYMKLQGKEGGQNKFPRVIKNEKLTQWKEYLDKNLKTN
ncbi:MAG: GH3 auxin-responsive promoter [Bacteroidetes bacterium HGW-Bacteroidetes-9]|nr:MAG: GH3 auxin-responsive promoter [Bacteroidetes bacterium HGW-Bacteroidetes-9]